MEIAILLISCGIIILAVFLYRKYIINKNEEIVDGEEEELEYFKKHVLKTQPLVDKDSIVDEENEKQ